MRRVIGLGAGVLSLLLLGCGSRPLQPWHKEVLKEEFSLRKAQQVASFSDYLELEERLWAELHSRVVAQVPTGPEQALVRYSQGSLAHPEAYPINWNRSFEWTVDEPRGGVLLLHGMSDSPYSLRALGESLSQQGYWVVALRLPGHGTAPSGLRQVSWGDMAAALRLAVEHLRLQVGGNRPLHLVGYSTGAPLAIDYTLEALERASGEAPAGPVPTSLVLISPALGIHPVAAWAAWKRRLSAVPGLGHLAWLSLEPEFDPFKYNSFSTNAAEQVHRLTRSVARRLQALAASGGVERFPPTLVFKSNVDATVSTQAVVRRLLEPLNSSRHELVLFDINRSAAKSSLMIYDPRALTTQLVGQGNLPFAFRLITNRDPDSSAAVVLRRPPRSTQFEKPQPLGLNWPSAVISLSHVALPFPPDDPLYGHPAQVAEASRGEGSPLFLGQMALQGERGLLLIPADWLMRLRHNPFYSYLDSSTLAWMRRAEASLPD